MCCFVRRAGLVGLLAAAVALLTGLPSSGAQDTKYGIKLAKIEVPSDLKEPIAKLFTSDAVQLIDGEGKAVCDIWLRKQLSVDVTPEQVKNGLVYQDFRETMILGAVRFHRAWTDYRQQRVNPGVYTMRFALQPIDGDHQGTADHREFCLLVSASKDVKSDFMEPKTLIEESRKSISSGHPAVMMMFPNGKPTAEPRLTAEANEHWVLLYRAEVTGAGTKTPVGFGLTLVGHGKE